MRYITEAEVQEFGSMKDTIIKIREAFEDYSAGNSSFSSRARLPFPKGSYIAMPGVFAKYGLAGLKTYVGNKSGIRHTVVFSTETAEIIAIIESSNMGRIKTGALPAMVSEKLVHGKNQNLCIIGSGFQAEGQLEGMLSVFDLEMVAVYSKTIEHARKFAESMSTKYGVDIKAYDAVKSALNGATIVNTITNSQSPIFYRKDLGVSYHVNLCGANIPSRVEVGEDVLAESDLVVVEHMPQAMEESAEIKALRMNQPWVKCIEVKDIMGNTFDPSYDKTVFKSMGVGLEDLAAAASLLQRMDVI